MQLVGGQAVFGTTAHSAPCLRCLTGRSSCGCGRGQQSSSATLSHSILSPAEKAVANDKRPPLQTRNYPTRPTSRVCNCRRRSSCISSHAIRHAHPGPKFVSSPAQAAPHSAFAPLHQLGRVLIRFYCLPTCYRSTRPLRRLFSSFIFSAFASMT